MYMYGTQYINIGYNLLHCYGVSRVCIVTPSARFVEINICKIFWAPYTYVLNDYNIELTIYSNFKAKEVELLSKSTSCEIARDSLQVVEAVFITESHAVKLSTLCIFNMFSVVFLQSAKRNKITFYFLYFYKILNSICKSNRAWMQELIFSQLFPPDNSNKRYLESRGTDV